MSKGCIESGGASTAQASAKRCAPLAGMRRTGGRDTVRRSIAERRPAIVSAG
ncbi:hypothetical protein BSIN_2190 [Burkholderia singularis]|uniref:Uncharacterized protein n=1 Tax=Burkholderia singularis TaxID=1503053 RepID=A0A238H161_9BURK|nr:hypothetical protein BSIN_2190 [Burkholderia singularis]